MIPYGKHSIDKSDIDAVLEVLENQFLTQGQQVPLFEKSLCKYTGASYAVACNSATSGLHIACLAAGVKPGDIVWTSPNSFAASANCARYCGAEVEFVDIDKDTRNICLEALTEKLNVASKKGQLPKAIIAVHFAGSSCNMKRMRELVAPHKVMLIEDAAHGLGGKDQYGNPIGSAHYSDFAVLSFHPVKSMTTAEGGAVLTNDAAAAERLRLFASHGISKEKSLLATESRSNPWMYAQHTLGFNYRLSDLHAALGNSQLRRLDHFIKDRRLKAKFYDDNLDCSLMTKPVFDENSAWHLYVIEVEHSRRLAVFEGLRERGIGVNVHYIPIYHHPYYQKLGYSALDTPNCEHYYYGAITLPLYPDLSADNQRKVVNVLHEVLF